MQNKAKFRFSPVRLRENFAHVIRNSVETIFPTIISNFDDVAKSSDGQIEYQGKITKIYTHDIGLFETIFDELQEGLVIVRVVRQNTNPNSWPSKSNIRYASVINQRSQVGDILKKEKYWNLRTSYVSKRRFMRRLAI